MFSSKSEHGLILSNPISPTEMDGKSPGEHDCSLRLLSIVHGAILS